MTRIANDNKETRLDDAERRRSLEGNTLFCNLGEPIQKLLVQLAKDVSDAELELFSKVTVRQLAKVYDMLALEEDPEKILAWLKRETLRTRGMDPGAPNPRLREKVRSGASRDPIAFYKEVEQKNIEMLEKFKKAQEEREQLRAQNVAQRRQRRQKVMEERSREREIAEKNGEAVNSVDRLNKTELADIRGTFERFSSKQSTFDNSQSAQDTEWWKKEEYRRDYEKNGAKGKKWNRVVEGGAHIVPESEMHVREEWYRSQCWWKAEKYKRDWLASRDTEWWKEEIYIRDWQDNGENGRMWTAADEVSGFNKKGHRRPANKVELENRSEWYKNNGPKGIVKLWCALTEGSWDRCTLEEKHERSDYYKNGDWWKSDIYIQRIREDPTRCAALRMAGAAAEDREWWKAEVYRKDFEQGGGKWKAATEKDAVTGTTALATKTEQKRREEWYSTNWWKTNKYIVDFFKNGSVGKLWRAAEPDNKSNKLCSAVEIKIREEWFRSCEDRDWWKDEAYIRDYHENGAQGKRWCAAWEQAALEKTGDVNRASDSTIREREKYYKENWWKQEKFVKDFVVNGSKGLTWRLSNPACYVDADWWKSSQCQKEFVASQKSNSAPFWTSPEYIADYWKNGATGKKWIAQNAAAGSINIGDAVQADHDELAEREAFYKANWWKQPEFKKDYAVNGRKGKLWRAANPDGTGTLSVEMLKERQEYFEPKQSKKVCYSFQSMLASDVENPVLGEPAHPDDIQEREEHYNASWWKNECVLQDYCINGSRGKVFAAKTIDGANSAVSGPDYECSLNEIADRQAFFDGGLVQDPKNNEFFEERCRPADFWAAPEYIEDYLINGSNGKKWTAVNAAAGSCGKGDTYRAGPNDLAIREEYLRGNFWKSRQYQADFERNGSNGTFWTFSEPNGNGKKISEEEMRYRSQFFKKGPVREHEDYIKKNWWKSPEVRSDFLIHGVNSKLLRAATAQVAVQGLTDQFPATEQEVKSRMQYFESGAVDEKASDAEFSRYLQKCEEFWQKPEYIADYLQHGNGGKKWKACNATAGSSDFGDRQPATLEQQKQREAFYKANFWRADEYLNDFIENGANGKLWKMSQPDGNGEEVSEAEQASRFAAFTATIRQKRELDKYAKENWWKAPEVQADFNAHGRNGKLFRAATAAVAALGLGSQSQYQASDEEIEQRATYFESGAKDPRLPDSEFSAQIQAVKNLGSKFWITPEFIDDYVKNGAKGKKWVAADAAAFTYLLFLPCAK